MSNLSVGIIGLPNAGKSTLFNALIRKKQAEVAEHPFTTIRPNKGTVEVPDERLERLWEATKIEKKTHSQLFFVDVAGLIKGAHQGEGLGNEFLGQIRNADCLLHVLRAFTNPQVSLPAGSIDPKRDLEIIETELLLSDSQMIERHLKEKSLSQGARQFFQKAKTLIDKGDWLKELKLTEEESLLLKTYPLLTAKPVLHVVNVDEKDLSSKPYSLNGIKALTISAKLESDLSELPWVEQRQYLKEAKVKYSALEAVVAACYHLLSLSTFYTLTGGREVRAWPFKEGTTAYEAAGMIHTDIKKGFIKAEVISFEEFMKISSWQKAKETGKILLQGRDYQVQDGDILEVKFSK